MIVLVTGANGGCGFEACRQLCAEASVTKIILGCRNKGRADAAVKSLCQSTNKPSSFFDILTVDTSDQDSCKAAVATLTDSLDCLILNAGGFGPKPGEKHKDGCTNLFALNVLGSFVFLEGLIAAKKFSKNARIVYVSSEVSRGISVMGIQQPTFDKSNLEKSMLSHADGSAYTGKSFVQEDAYGYAKQTGSCITAYLAKKHPDLYFCSVSPGGTLGTAMTSGNDLKGCFKIVFQWFLIPVMGPCLFHPLEVGAARYVDAACSKDFPDRFPAGTFAASPAGRMKGTLCDQSKILAGFADEKYHAAAYNVFRKFRV